MSDIAHKTAVELSQLRGFVSPERFRELTGSLRIEDLAQEDGAKIVTHLKDLSDYYTDFTNILIGWHEEFQHPGINPRGMASLVPKLIDRISRDTWR